MSNQNKSGYILVLTLMIIGLATVIVTNMFYQSGGFLPLSSLAIKRQKAKNLALGGVQLALSKLNAEPKTDLDMPDQNKSKQDSKELFFLKQILPNINCWDKINLREETDGVDGVIEFCLVCEDGKINLNQWYDFEKHEFIELKDSDKITDTKQAQVAHEPKQVGLYEQALALLFEKLSKITNNEIDAKNSLDGLKNFLAARDYQLLDVTELLTIPQFSYFKENVFHDLTTINNQSQKNMIYLTDLFTINTSTAKLEPWLFSQSILTILGFPRADSNDILKRSQTVSTWTKDFKLSSQWTKDWDQTVGQMYSVKLGAIENKLLNLFTNKFNPKAFSVLSYGTVGDITQKVCAFIKAQPTGKDNKQNVFIVEKLYWI